MQYSYRLAREAEDDLFESYLWYESQRTGLGDDFLDAIEIARDLILSWPLSYQVVYKKVVRAHSVNKFPFRIFYVVEETEINIIAVFHTARNPKTWKRDLSKIP